MARNMPDIHTRGAPGQNRRGGELSPPPSRGTPAYINEYLIGDGAEIRERFVMASIQIEKFFKTY